MLQNRFFPVPSIQIFKKLTNYSPVIWVTGASSGIGRELCKVLAQNGAKLVLSARNLRELELTRQECLQLSKGLLREGDILVIPLDMLKLNYHQDSLNRVISHFRALDILVNNAGRSQRAEWEKIDINVDRELFEIDVFSVIHLSRLTVKYFEQHHIKGQLAVTSSTAGLIGAPNSGSYTGAKHALHVSVLNRKTWKFLTVNFNGFRDTLKH
jgi:dehydrogenase/reductase SDR family protein 7